MNNWLVSKKQSCQYRKEKTEKKIFQGDPPIAAGKDNRCGLNLTYRTLAAVIKYDRIIPQETNHSPEHPIRGYYATEKELVSQIKKHVLAGYPPKSHENKPFKTIENQTGTLLDRRRRLNKTKTHRLPH